MFVVGAGNSAGQAAMYLARYAKSVTHAGARQLAGRQHVAATSIERIERDRERRASADRRCDQRAARRAEPRGGLDPRYRDRRGRPRCRRARCSSSSAPRRAPTGSPDALQLDQQATSSRARTRARAGRKPNGWLAEREPSWLETSVPGIFVAGDVRRQSTKRIASAVGEGAMAMTFVHQHLRGPAIARAAAPQPGS